MKKLNWNAHVKVKLTDFGRTIYKRHYQDICDRFKIENRDPSVDSKGYSDFQLWVFMEIFGPGIYMAGPKVTEDISFYIDDEDLETEDGTHEES